MAGRIVKEDIESLRDMVDVAQIVGDHTSLKKAGARLKGLCPFHGEKTPSFTVDPARGLYHCFGCGEGGDVYDFLQKIEGLTFVEAVEQVARRVGYELHYEELSAGQRKAIGERSRLVAAHHAALEFFQQQLYAEAGAVAREYLKSRGFGRDEADQFKIGFAPLDWEALAKHLLAQRFGQDELVKSGLVARNDRGGVRDRFRGRLMFPVLDLNGDPIGFGGRILPDLDYGEHTPPKYLNTPETPIYRKHKVLYGMSWARADVVRSGEVLICEGYTDVMALHQAGYTNAAATCGTAVGEDHFKLLSRYAQRVVLAFDSDEAGAKAAERAWRIAKEHDVDVRVLIMPAGKDPADVVRDGGADHLAKLVEEAPPVAPFVLERAVQAHDLTTPEGRAAAVSSAAPVLADVVDPVLRREYAKHYVADVVGLALDVVAQSLRAAGVEVAGTGSGHIGGRAGVGPVQAARPSTARRPGAGLNPAARRASLERDVLRLALQRPDLLPDAWYQVTEDDFTHPKARAVFRALRDAGGPGTALEAVLEQAADDDARALVRGIALEDGEVEPDPAHAATLVNRLLVARVEQEVAWVKSELQAVNETTDPARHRELFRRLMQLEQQRRELSEVPE